MKRAIIGILALVAAGWFVVYWPLVTAALRMLTSYFCDLSNQSGGNLTNRHACAMYRHPNRLAVFLTVVLLFMSAIMMARMVRMHRV